MQDISQKCIFSGSTENLNTIMEVTIDDEQYKVAVSDEFEDEATPKNIRKLVPARVAELDTADGERLKKLDQLTALAKELGVEIGPASNSGLVLAKNIEQSDRQQPPQLVRQPAAVVNSEFVNSPTVQVNGEQFKMQKNTRTKQTGVGLSREETAAALEAAKRRAETSAISEGASQRDAPRFNSHSIPSSATTRDGATYEKPTVFAKEMQTIKGREGVPVTIPRIISGSDGETTITIVDTGGDKMLRERTKMLDRLPDYSEPCRPCKGTGVVNRVNCIHCGGVGILY